MIDPHADDEAEYAAAIEWQRKVQRARDRVEQARNTHTPR